MKHKKLRFGTGFKVVLENVRAQAAQMVLEPGKSEGHRGNRHDGADQWLYVVSGSGVAIVNGKRLALAPGGLLLIERGDRHEIRNDGDKNLATLNFYSPPAYRRDGSERRAGKPAEDGPKR